MKKYRWVVMQKDFGFSDDDVFDTKKEAQQYLKDCFEPEHKAKIIKVEAPTKD